MIMERINFEVPETMKNQLSDIAKEQMLSLSDIMRIAVKNYLDSLNKPYQAKK